MSTSQGTPSRRVALTTAGIAAGAAVLLGLGIAASAEASQIGPFGTTIPTTASATSVDTSVAAALQYNREEERLARDVYAALAERYDGAAPFSMITRSEQTHYDAIGTLLDRYGVADPSAGRPAGDYADPTLQALYDDLMKQGSVSLDSAYDVGIAIENQDIADLDKELAGTLPADVRTVLDNLRAGSENHLAAFQRAADGNLSGGGYGTGMSGRWSDGTTAGSSDDTRGQGRMGGMGSGARGAGPVGDGTCLTDTSI